MGASYIINYGTEDGVVIFQRIIDEGSLVEEITRFMKDGAVVYSIVRF